MKLTFFSAIRLISVLSLSAAWGAASAADEVDRLLDRVAAQEDHFIANLRNRTAVIETYIQEMPEGGDSQAIVRDHYFLGKLAFGENLVYTPMASRGETSREPRLLGMLRSRSVAFVPSGFAQMVLIDAAGLSRKLYHLEYVRREFLGELRCMLFDVTPLDAKAPGRFKGRIWVEDRKFQIVRFNGTYTNGTPSRVYFHFDSWRLNVASGDWVPAFVYVEESGPVRKGAARFKAQTRLWGFNVTRSGGTDELSSIAVEAEKGVTDRDERADSTPLENQRSWERQAEANILERLQKAGLLAPPGPVDEVLNTVVNNLVVTNHLGVGAKCRVLLTTPLESFFVGRTIVISRGLLDVLPDEASLAMVLSGELAHIALGHQTETHFAFADQTMVGEQELLERLRLTRTPAEIQSAGEKAVEFLKASPYAPKLANAGLFLKALESRAAELPNLVRANLGNQLASGDSLLRMKELADRAPSLEPDKLEQLAALPLGSRVRLDPWTDEISLVKTKPVALVSARDKLPFEITPFMIFLSRADARLREQDPEAGDGAPVQHTAGNSPKKEQ